jgi:hypothetical protein
MSSQALQFYYKMNLKPGNVDKSRTCAVFVGATKLQAGEILKIRPDKTGIFMKGGGNECNTFLTTVLQKNGGKPTQR